MGNPFLRTLSEVSSLKTGVLVIGSGGAGLTAAVAAAKSGADVCLVSKTQIGLNTATAYSGGIFSYAGGGVTPEEHYTVTMKAGCGVNDPVLLKTLTEEAAASLDELRSWGVDIRFPRPGKASVRHTAKYALMAGAGFVEQLAAVAREQYVKMVEFSVATKLLRNNAGVCGARLVNWKTGKSLDLFADAVILATGGAGQIFARTDNPARLTGDGYALAHCVGAELRDMEFIQFYPLGWDDQALPVWMGDLGLIDFLPLTDADGNEFLLQKLHEWGFKSGSEGNLYARDRSAVALAQAARDGGAFVHFEKASPELWQDKRFLRTLVIDPARFQGLNRPVRVSPLEHYFCGGVTIDTYGHTSVPGLYACGEVTGGVDGANRVGGNALANIVTFGLRAGKTAAQETQRASGLHENSAPSPTFSAEGTSPIQLRRALQNKMWETLGPIRTAKGLNEALTFLAEFINKPIRASSSTELLAALEMPGLICTARESAKAALARTHSLGVHFRADDNN